MVERQRITYIFPLTLLPPLRKIHDFFPLVKSKSTNPHITSTILVLISTYSYFLALPNTYNKTPFMYNLKVMQKKKWLITKCARIWHIK